MSTPFYDVAVIGGGPAGSTVARRCAAADMCVALYDRARFPRDKTCGDGLSTPVLTELAPHLSGAETTGELWPLTRGHIIAPDGYGVILTPPSRRPYAGTIRRERLDQRLWDAAHAAGVVCYDGTSIHHTRQNGEKTTLIDTQGRILGRARQVVRAVGARPSQRATPNDLVATRVYVATPYIDSTFHVWFHPKLEGGYVWAFPLGDGYLNLGAIARARMGRDVVEITRRLVNAGGSETMKLEWEDTEDRVRAWPIPTSTRTLTYPNGTIVVGDAAGAGDPMTGEGIWGALVTARYAADAIISHPYQPHHAAAHYRAHVNRWLEVRQRTARIYRRMLVHPMFVNVAVHSMNLHQKLRERYGALIMDETLRHTFKDSLTMVMLGR